MFGVFFVVVIMWVVIMVMLGVIEIFLWLFIVMVLMVEGGVFCVVVGMEMVLMVVR